MHSSLTWALYCEVFQPMNRTISDDIHVFITLHNSVRANSNAYEIFYNLYNDEGTIIMKRKTVST
ncbi:hypothetical protein T4D_5938 [Trichinella pseudospiralis]|uniref:Uncharacterized protein n=1 Tax=Trichinella pseudospiralis TaxID=6337 RepID=A0A0V1FY17_TRIPS|nr:hypothetical protein T4D_5938 [Trichinella pseudospiralis]